MKTSVFSIGRESIEWHHCGTSPFAHQLMESFTKQNHSEKYNHN